MNNTTILKALELLKSNNTNELTALLTSELLKTKDKKQANLYNTIKTYLKNVEKSRPLLQTLQHRNGKQFVIDGYSMAIFNKHFAELETLPKTENEELCIDYGRILVQSTAESITEQEIEFLKNIKKYIDFAKAQPDYTKKDKITAPFRNQIFDTYYLLFINNLYNSELENLQIKFDITRNLQPVQFESENITSLILPIRATEEGKIKTMALYQKFITEINRGEILKWLKI